MNRRVGSTAVLGRMRHLVDALQRKRVIAYLQLGFSKYLLQRGDFVRLNRMKLEREG